jgi:hypothetical protein
MGHFKKYGQKLLVYSSSLWGKKRFHAIEQLACDCPDGSGMYGVKKRDQVLNITIHAL